MDAATIEETNRIRLSLGMKPLPVPGAAAPQQPRQRAGSESDEEPASTLESRQARAYDNYKSHIDAEASKKRREEKTAAVRKARDNAQRFAALEGKGLGDDDERPALGAKAWLMGQKKRLKRVEKARKLEEELAAAEAAAAQAVQYTSKDLAGIKVAHDTSAFLEADEQVLTLKDATIDENELEGDELENINLRDHEKLAERLELKKKRPGYNPNDEEYNGERGMLSQYDEEIHGKKTTKFTLDSDGAIAELSDILGQPSQKTNKLQNVSLDDILGDAPASSDYLASSEIKIKKPKKKKSKTARQKQHDEDDIFPPEPAAADGDAMELDTAHGNKRKATSDAFVDDDDLQASLAIQRKHALNKRKKMRPEDIAKQLKEQANELEQERDSLDGGLVIGEISEFVAGLSKHDDDEAPRSRRQKSEANTQRGTGSRSPEAHEDDLMKDADEADGGHAPATDENGQAHGTEDNSFDEEKTVGGGMGAALALLRERGLIEDSRGSISHESHRERQDFLKRKRELEEELEEKARQQRERDRASGKWDRMSKADREEYARQQNAWRDHQHSRRMVDLITSTYKPNVELKYVDDHGRSLDQKEAFKHLSHQFHGKGSGKGKTEKKLKQIEDEKRRESHSLFDASQGGGMNAATTQQLKKRKEAGVRLG